MGSSTTCQQCAKMLKHVLAQDNSRPMAILEAMGGKQGEEQATGATIQIPRASDVKSQQWTQLHTGSSSDETVPIPTATAMATSATNLDPLITPQLENSSSYESLKIECRPCSNVGPESGARAFVMGPNPLSIVLCSNRLSFHGPEEMEQVLVHELVHVYDVRINQLDLRSCENLAYSEVRAAREAECKDAWLANRYCIPQKAYHATSNLFPAAQARACLSRVFDTAMADTAPLPRPCATSSATTTTTKLPKRRESFYFGGMRPSER